MNKTRAELIGDRLRELRGERPQKEVADAVNVSVMAISKYERGQIIPGDDVKIAEAKDENHKRPGSDDAGHGRL